jgi:hypothetical protein
MALRPTTDDRFWALTAVIFIFHFRQGLSPSGRRIKMVGDGLAAHIPQRRYTGCSTASVFFPPSLERAIMDLNSVRKAVHGQPFKPFTLRLADGRSVPVGHPEFVAMTERIIVVVDEGGGWSAIEPLLIVSLDYPSSKPGQNGAGRKKRRPPSD